MTAAILAADAQAVATLIAQRKSVPATTETNEVVAGAALILMKAGKAISPNAASADKVLAVLSQIEDLLPVDTGIMAKWAAVRALNVKSGQQVGISGAMLDDAIIVAFVSAAGIIPTTDVDANVRAQLGDMEGRGLDTVAAQGRIVTLTDKGEIEISNGTGQIASVLVAADPKGAVAAIDAKAAQPAGNLSKIVPMAFNCVDAAQLSEFSASMFSNYKVRRLEIPGAMEHPTELVESSALASVLPPEPSYKPFFHPDVINKGILSDVQLETVIYAGDAHSKYLASHPDDKNAAAPRQGFLMGHGPGFGKGRATAAIFADNWAQGRRRGMWFSESARLIDDARRDWKDIGGNPADIVDIREISSSGAIPPFSGIIFATYASLRSESEFGSRLRQLIDWFGPAEDGVIAFDEAQNLRNTRTKKDTGWSNQISKQGEAAAELQNATPNSRVVYASATSASDITSLGFAVRLGLWGRGTSFPSADSFFKAMSDGGTNALEMVARDMKAMGLYLAANLSFEGVTFERVEHQLTKEERASHDALSEIWQKVGLGLRRALASTGITAIPKKSMTNGSRMGTINYGMAKARFFQATSAATKTPMMIEMMRQDIKNGHAPIVQMHNTFAANADKAIAAAIEAGDSMDTVEATPRDILLHYMERYFPTVKYTMQGKGKNAIAVPVVDANGDQVECPKAVALRDQLIGEVCAVPMPEGPLEQLMNAFGPDMIAEITGRKQRLLPTTQGGRFLEERSSTDVKRDAQAFFDDIKQILAFSPAGGTGATYSASRSYRNQRKRRHYLLQAGWRGDQAIQGMGRSHRSNQAETPDYILLCTDLWSDQRMISAVAKGMRDLGALTRGQRQAASQEFFTQDDNLEDEFAQEAWINFVNNLANGSIQGISIGRFEREAGIVLRQNGTTLIKPLPPIKRFLNAMSGMSYSNQILFGRHYKTELQALKLAAIETGMFDRGIETIQPDSLIKLEDTVIYRDPRTGGETRMLKMLRIDELEPMDYPSARSMAVQKGNMRVMKSIITGRIAMLSFPRGLRNMAPSGDDRVEVITPTGARTRTRAEVAREGWTMVDITIAEQMWAAELVERGDEEEQTFWVISGAMLPIWNKLPRNRPMVYRMETDESEQIIGRLVSEEFVNKLLSRVDALTGGGLTKEQVDEALVKDGVVSLVNGWTISGRTSAWSNKQTFTLAMPLEDEGDFTSLINQAQMTKTVGMMRNQAYYRLPVGETDRLRSIDTLIQEHAATAAAVM